MPELVRQHRKSNRYPRIYLTFDDGPNLEFTPKILELLRQHEARATFFLIGQSSQDHSDLTQLICEDGHGLANHSFSHQPLASKTLAEQLNEIERTETVMSSYSTHVRKLFRPPWGKITWKLFWALKRRGYVISHWSYDSGDYKKEPYQNIVKRFQQRPVANGDIVLFHDDNEATVKALEVMLPEWKKQGLEFGTL